MGRVLLALAWIILLLLLVDSAMHDPDVQPVVDRQITRVERSLDRIASWFKAKRASASSGLTTNESDFTPVISSPTEGPAETWYWSTTLGVAATLAGLAKSSVRATRRAPAASANSCRATDLRVGRRP